MPLSISLNCNKSFLWVICPCLGLISIYINMKKSIKENGLKSILLKFAGNKKSIMSFCLDKNYVPKDYLPRAYMHA